MPLLTATSAFGLGRTRWSSPQQCYLHCLRTDTTASFTEYETQVGNSNATHVKMFTLTHTHQFNGPLSRTTQASRSQKGKTNLNFTETRDSEWQWHQLGHMQVCTSLQTDNHASTPPRSFLQAECPSCRQTNSVRALKALKFTVV